MKKQIILAIFVFAILAGLIGIGIFDVKKQEKEKKKYTSEKEKQLTNFGEGARISGFSWHPHGMYIIFSAHSKEENNFRIFIINSDDNSEKQIIPNERNVFDPCWSPSGDYILFVSHKVPDLQNWIPAPYEIWEMYPNGSGQRKILGDMKGKSNPAYSPDGKKIIFTATKADMLSLETYDPQKELWIADRNGTNQKSLLKTDKLVESIIKSAWGPDGEKIFVEFYGNGKYGLLKMPSNGENKVELIAPDLHIRDFSLSANGEKIAFILNGEIWIMNSDGSNQQQLTNDKTDISNLAWSPDGKKMAFLRGNEIWTIEVPPTLVLESQKAKEITEWLTYTDSKYGYSIKYPNTWYLRKDGEVLLIESTKKPLYWDTGVGPKDPDAVALEGYSISIFAQQNTKKLSLEQYIASVVSRGNNFTSQKMTINGLEAIEAHEKEGWIAFSPDYFLAYDNYVYEIGCGDRSGELNGLQDIAEQIVQSFSFAK